MNRLAQRDGWTRVVKEQLRAAWGDLFGRFDWEWFVTVTFKGKANVKLAVDEMRWWCEHASQIYRMPLGFLYAPERGRGGRWHGHILLIGRGKSGDLANAVPSWRERNGRIDARRVVDSEGAALYTTKDEGQWGAVDWSDTLTRYQHLVRSDVVVPLVPDGDAIGDAKDDLTVES